jgi:ribosomal protein S18 acetylase RimI-like enzyme
MLLESPYRIRLAKLEEVDALTDLHIRSFCPNDHVPVMLGKTYVRATYRWLIAGGSAYVLVAEEENNLIALIAVCDGPFTGRMFKACLPEFFLSLAHNPALLINKKLWQRLLRRSGINKVSRRIVNYPGLAQMTIGAVDENCRGKGVFPDLVKATIKYSRERGSRAIRAGVYKENNASRRVFIKEKWLEIPELETSETVFYVSFIDPKFEKELR